MEKPHSVATRNRAPSSPMRAALVPSPSILSQQQGPVTCVSQSTWDKKEGKILVSHQSSVGLSCGYPNRADPWCLCILKNEKQKNYIFSWWKNQRLLILLCDPRIFKTLFAPDHALPKLQYLSLYDDEKSNFKNNNSNVIIVVCVRAGLPVHDAGQCPYLNSSVEIRNNIYRSDVKGAF